MKKTLCTIIALAIGTIGTAFGADLNKDDAATITKDMIGVGMKKAEMIVNERNAKGPFKDDMDLRTRVKGIGPKTLEKNVGKYTFGPATAAAPAATPVTTAPATAVPAAAPATVPTR